MGMRDWWYLDTLASFGDRPLPVRLRIYLASGLAERSGTAELDARRADSGPWVRLEGIKFYADGWLVPRTCAMCRSFDDEDTTGILFAGASTLARRIEPFAATGWRIATHAIGDRAVRAVLDAYELTWGGDRRALAAAAPRIEHGSVLSAELVSRIAELGVAVCIQPSFAVTDAAQVPVALGGDRSATAYPWASLAALGVTLLSGTDYPIEVIEPLVSLARLVRGRSRRARLRDRRHGARALQAPCRTGPRDQHGPRRRHHLPVCRSLLRRRGGPGQNRGSRYRASALSCLTGFWLANLAPTGSLLAPTNSPIFREPIGAGMQ